MTRSALDAARRVIEIEVEALRRIGGRLGADFERAVEIVCACKGKVIVTGMGKSGQICRKIAATLSSTGSSAIFVHAAEASHGDLGIFSRDDACIAVSNSGTTAAVLDLLETMKRLSLPLIAMTGTLDSPLAQAADVVLDVSVESEACPLGLAPTASTTAALALGDALAVAAFEEKGFCEEDFALLHPGGALGRRFLRVSDLMHASADLPRVATGAALRDTVDAITKGGLGTVAVVDGDGHLVGVVTDGDIRRAVLANPNLAGLSAADVMTEGPRTVAGAALAAEALALMEKHGITSLFIVDSSSGDPLGIVHLHDLLKAHVA